jgi:hypothetical protein
MMRLVGRVDEVTDISESTGSRSFDASCNAGQAGQAVLKRPNTAENFRSIFIDFSLGLFLARWLTINCDLYNIDETFKSRYFL